MEKFSQAMVFGGAGLPLEPQRFTLSELAPGEVLAEVICCTLCGSDLHTFAGRRQGPAPTILGHEILGRVVEIGGDGSLSDWNGQPLNIGDRITWSIAASCGQCFFCERDLPQKCERLFKYGHQATDSASPLSGKSRSQKNTKHT